MIIFGLRSGNARQKQSLSYDCAHCGTPESVQMHLWVRYFHIFWIPVIPLYKSGQSQCRHCKQALDAPEMPQHLVQGYQTARKQAGISVRYFSWPIIAALFFGIAMIAVMTDSRKTDTFIQQPLAGDVYEIKGDDGYTLYRITEVNGDTVIMNPHLFTAEKLSAFRRLKNYDAEEYSDETFPLAKNELLVLRADGVIRKINRAE